MDAGSLLGALGIYAGTFAVAAISSVLPFVVIDVFLIGVAVVAPVAALPLVVALAAIGQLVGKLPIYYGSRALVGARADKLRARLARWQRVPRAAIFATALLGPFSISATAAGILGVGPRAFSVLVLAGRALRFAAVVALVQLR